jgi:protein-L-isoaspartate O-methyltransferase
MMIHRRSLILSAAPLLAAVRAASAQQKEQPSTEKLAPYYPTPELVVEKMLSLAGTKAGEKMFDLGSGDGRIVIMAAEKFKADATGIEFDKDLYQQSSDRIKKLGLASRARIIHGDILKQDYSSADVITVYLLPLSNDKVRPILDKQLKKGTRIVAHDFEFSDWTPIKTFDIDDDGEGRSHRLYLYQR